MEEELEHDAEGNVIPRLDAEGRHVHDPQPGLPLFMPRIDPKTGKAMLRPVMQWAHRDAEPNTLKWLLSHQYGDEFDDAPDKVVSITAIANDQTMKTIATRVEAYQKKRALPPPCEVVSDAIPNTMNSLPDLYAREAPPPWLEKVKTGARGRCERTNSLPFIPYIELPRTADFPRRDRALASCRQVSARASPRTQVKRSANPWWYGLGLLFVRRQSAILYLRVRSGALRLYARHIR
jgi:hypothetical protein